MKIYTSLFSLLLFVLQLSNAQSFTKVSNTSGTSISSCSTNYATEHTRINVSIDGEQQLKVQMLDGDLDLELNFDSRDVNKISELISRYLGDPDLKARGVCEWSCAEGSYLIRLKNNQVDMSVHKMALSTGQWLSFIGFATDVLREAGCELELNLE